MRIELRHVEFMPRELEAGVLYVSEEYGTAAHLCACGCGSKVRTPLGPTGWTVQETRQGPTMDPSIGSWQLPCRSHYLIIDGEIVWAPQWSEARIDAGRRREKLRRRDHYDRKGRDKETKPGGLWRWVKSLFNGLKR